MAFCYECGKELVEGAKFCFECGAQIGRAKAAEPEKSKTKEGGRFHKCPGCGATVGSFSTHCPMCGSEVDHIQAASSVKALVEKLERISARQMPPTERKLPSKDMEPEDILIEEEMERASFESQKDREKAELIVNFPVPNSKEEILEFMLLASSNVDVKKGMGDPLNKAWKTKLDQVYEKAKLAMSNTADFAQVKKIYEAKQAEFAKKKRKTKRILLTVGILLLALAGVITWLVTRPTEFETLQVKKVTMEIADYWTEGESEKNCLKYYDDYYGEDKVTLDVKFVAETDKKYDVTYEGLYADNKNMIKTLEKMYWDANVLEDETFESDYGVKGILYTFSLDQSTGWFSSEAAKGYCFCFPSESDRRWFYVTMIVVNSVSDGSQLEDYMKTLASIRCE